MTTATRGASTSPRRGHSATQPPEAFLRLVGRFDPDVLRLGSRPKRLRLQVRGGDAWDVEITRDGAVLLPPRRRVPDDGLIADAEVWPAVADDARHAYRSFFDGTLRNRGSAHLTLGFLAMIPVALWLLARGRGVRGATVPFGPLLALGAAVVLLA